MDASDLKIKLDGKKVNNVTKEYQLLLTVGTEHAMYINCSEPINPIELVGECVTALNLLITDKVEKNSGRQ